MRARLLLPLAAATAALLVGALPAAAQQDDPQPPASPPPSIERPGVYVDELPGSDVIPSVSTAVTMIVGAGTTPTGQPGQALEIGSVDDFEQLVQGPSVALSGAVAQFFAQGGQTARVQLVADENAPTLQAALSGPVADQHGWNMLVVPSMGALDQASWTQVGQTMGTVAQAQQAVAYLDPPSSVVQPGDADWVVALTAATAPLQQSPAASSMGILSSPLVVDGQSVSSAAAIAGMSAAKDTEDGVWSPPGGVGQPLAGGATALVTADNDDAGVLRDGGINPVMSVPGVGTVVYGDRTMTTADGATQFMSCERTLDMIRSSVSAALQPYVFEPNGPQAWSEVTASVTEFLTTLWQQGALEGATASEAFTVDVGDGSAPTSAEDGGDLMVVQMTVQLVDWAPIPLTLTQQTAS